jgi:O-antigen/teichoic acid export membrane protein
LSGGLWVTGARVVGVLASAGVSVIAARVLGPAGTGELALAVAVFGLLSTIGTLGIDVGVIWEVTRGFWPPTRAFASVQRVAAGVGIGVAALAASLYAATSGLWLAGAPTLSMIPVFVALPFALSWMLGSSVALGADRYELAFAPPGIQSAAYFVAVAALAPVFGVEGALVAVLVGHVAACAAVLAGRGTLPLGVGDSSRGDDRRHLEAAIRFGATPYAAAILTMINFRIDLLLLAAFTKPSDVGIYAVAVGVTAPLAIVTGAIGLVLFPRLASLEDDREAASDVEGSTLRHAVVLIVVGEAALAILLLFLVTPLFGARFAPVTEAGLILLPGAGALALFHALSGAITGRGRPQAVLKATLLVTPPALLLYVVLIRAYGINGAAAASSISYAANALLLAIYLRRADGQPLLARLVPGRREMDDYRAFARRLRHAAVRSE